MKKVFLSIIVILSFLIIKAQYPISQSLGGDKILVTNPGGLKSHLINYTYVDTTSANLDLYIKYYNGAQIVTTSGGAKFWVRLNNTWVQTGGGSGGNGWLLGGNALTNPTLEPFGSTNNQDVNFITNNLKRFSLNASGFLSQTINTVGIGRDTTTGYLTDFAGGSGGISTASFPLVITGSNIAADTTKKDSSLVTYYQLTNRLDSILALRDTIATTLPLYGTLDTLTGQQGLAMYQSGVDQDGWLSLVDWNIFNDKVGQTQLDDTAAAIRADFPLPGADQTPWLQDINANRYGIDSISHSLFGAYIGTPGVNTYGTYDPAAGYANTLSNTDHTITSDGLATGSRLGTLPMAMGGSGKPIVKFRVSTVGGGATAVGIQKTTGGDDVVQWPGQEPNTIGYRTDGDVYQNNVSIASAASYTSADSVWVGLDLVAGEAKFYKNQTLVATITGLTGSWKPIAGGQDNAPSYVITINYGDTPLGTLPSGGWNTGWYTSSGSGVTWSEVLKTDSTDIFLPSLPDGVGTQAVRVGSDGKLYKADTTVNDVNEILDPLPTTLFPSLPSNFLTYSASPTFSSGMTLTPNGGSFFDGFVYGTDIVTSLNYTITDSFLLNTKPAIYADGHFVGMRSENLSIALAYGITTRMATSSTWRLTYTGLNNYATQYLLDSSGTIGMVNGDIYKIYIAANNLNIYAKFTHYSSAGVEIENTTMVHTYSRVASVFDQPANTGVVFLGALGSTGSYKVRSLVKQDYAFKQTDIVWVGNSIGVGYDAISSQSMFPYVAMQGSNLTWTNIAGGGDRLQEYILRKNQILSAAGNMVIYQAGDNDNAGDIRTYLVPLIDTMQARGKTPIILTVFPTQAAKDSVFENVCREQGVLLIEAGHSLTSDMYTDGIHLNGRGNQRVGQIVRDNIPAIATTGSVDGWSFMDGKDVQSISLANNQSFIWDASIKKMKNVTGGGAVGADGYVQFATSGVLNSSVNNYWDNSNGRLSLRAGTSPTSTLHVYSSNPADGIRNDGLNPAYMNAIGGVLKSYFGTAASNGAYVANSTTDDMFFRNETSSARFLFATGGATNPSVVIHPTLGMSILKATGGNPTEALDVTGNFRLSGAFMPNNTAGTSGYLLQSAGAGAPPTWVAQSSLGVPINGLTSATGNGAIDNGNNNMYWEWNTLGNNYGLVLNTTSTAAASNNQTMLKITMSGANATSTQTTYGQQIANNHTGTGSTNVALFLDASLGTNNYALIIPASSGSVGIGNSAPTSILDVTGNIAHSTVTKTATYTAANDYTIICSTNTFTINLPTAVGISGRIYVIKNITTATTITVDGNASETIDGATTYSLASQYKFVQIQSDGANWNVIGNN